MKQVTTADPNTCSSAFRSAITKFRSRLTGNQLSEFPNATYQQLCQDIIRLQHEQEKGGLLRNLARIQSCLEAMHHFSKTIEVFLNVSNAVAFIWGPIKFLLMTASNFVDSFDSLLEAYEQIGENLPLLTEYESIFGDDPRMLEVLELIYIDILEFHSRALRFFRGRAWNKLFKALWKDHETQFGGTLRRLARHKELMQTRAHLHQSSRHQNDMTRIDATLDRYYHSYRQDIPEIRSQVKNLCREAREKTAMAVKQWLASGQIGDDHLTNLEIRAKFPGTGDWILRNQAISDWISADDPQTPMVWMHGMPGAGKTVLASIIIEACKSRIDSSTSYFYCHYNGQDTNTAVGVLRGLISQIAEKDPGLMAYCLARRSNSCGEPVLRSLPIARNLLEDLCHTVGKQYIIVDGIDECDAAERKQLLEYLVHLTSQCEMAVPGSMRVLLISQEFLDIKRALFHSAATKITPKVVALTSADNQSDIRIYVDSLAQKIQDHYDLTEEQVQYLKKLSLNRAKGMFLYVVLVLPNLLQLPTRESFFEEIREVSFPKGLEEAYERILKRIRETSVLAQWEMTKKLMGWLICAKRQLTLREIQAALSINLEDQSIDYDERRLRGDIQDICGSLVRITNERVALVHSTAKFYISKCSKDVHEPSVECDLAVLCLRYLTFQCFDEDKDIDSRQLKDLAMEGQMALQDYAVAKWFHHVNATIETGPQLMQEGSNILTRLEDLKVALEDFLVRYDQEDWQCTVNACKAKCEIFRDEAFHDDLVAVASHIYRFQNKGFEARHVVNIKALAIALERNRRILEGMVGDKKKKGLSGHELEIFRRFYDDSKPYKCSKITCLYFSEGFKEAKAQKRHNNLHDRPFQCEVSDCQSNEYGFTNDKDLQKHVRTFHPELSDLAQSFKPSNTPKAKKGFQCQYCGKLFTRGFHKRNHERAHRGERPHECPECPRTFTRANDCRRHQKLHDRR